MIDKSRCWDFKTNVVHPATVFKSSKNQYSFICDVCSHSFTLALYSVTAKVPYWCYYCSGKRLCKREDCKLCFEKSFASHPKAKSWSSENKCKPRDVFMSTPKKFHFVCETCEHSFLASPNGITSKRGGNWCPRCVNKTERKLYGELKKNYPDVIQEYKVEWCRSPENNRYYPYDFFIPSLNVIIEIDGPQHFKQIMNWETPERTQSKDLYKMKKAFDEKISIIRIPYEYVFNDKIYNTKRDILFGYLKLFDEPKMIYICDDDRYNPFQNINFKEIPIPEIIPK